MSKETDENILVSVGKEKVDSLHSAGVEAADLGQSESAAELFKQAMEMAEATGYDRMVKHCQWHYGTELLNCGRLRLGLAVLAPILRNNIDSISPERVVEFLAGLISYVKTAIDLPVSLGAINKGITELENQVAKYRDTLDDENGEMVKGASRLLRITLYGEQGRLLEARNLCQEVAYLNLGALAYQYLVDLNIELEDTKEAERYLQKWERVCPEGTDKEWSLCLWRSELAVVEGKFVDGVNWARKALNHAEQIGSTNHIYSAKRRLLKALLASGECQAARPYLFHILAKRRSESEHDRYDIHRLRGDYHLTVAQKSAETVSDIDGPAPGPPPQLLRLELKRLIKS